MVKKRLARRWNHPKPFDAVLSFERKKSTSTNFSPNTVPGMLIPWRFCRLSVHAREKAATVVPAKAVNNEKKTTKNVSKVINGD